MGSKKKPVSFKRSNNLICKICSIKCNSLMSLNHHYQGAQHKKKEQFMSRGMLGRLPKKEAMEEVFYNPNRKAAIIGLQYLKEFTNKKGNPYYSCTLCKHVILFSSLHLHLVSLVHMKTYISKAFPFLLQQIPEESTVLVEKIAEAIEAVEGLSKYKASFTIPQQESVSMPFNSSSRKIVNDQLIEKLAESGMHFKNPSENKITLAHLEIGLHHISVHHKKELQHEHSRTALSCATPMSSSPLASSSIQFSMEDKMLENESPLRMGQAADTFSGNVAEVVGDYVSENSSMQQDCRPFDYGFSSSIIPPVYGSPGFMPSADSSNTNVDYSSCGYIHQMQSQYTQVIPDSVHAYRTAEGNNYIPEPTCTHAVANLYNSSSSLTCSSGKFATNDCSVQDSSRYVGSSIRDAPPSESALSSSDCTVLNERSCYPISNSDSPASQVSHPSATASSHVTPLQITESSTTCSRLSPDTLKMLQGKDVVTVKSILNDLSRHCPPLKKVNIEMLVDVLFESGALG